MSDLTFIEVPLISRVLVAAAELNGASEQTTDHARRGGDAGIFGSNVPLQARSLVNTQLPPLVDWASQAAVILTGVQVVGVVFRVVNVLFRAVAAESLAGDLELAGAVSEAHESQNPQQKSDCLSRDILDGAHVDSLAVISQPIAKVRSLDIQLAELLSTKGAGGEEGEEGVFDVAVTPVDAFDLGGAADVSSAKGQGGAGVEDEGEGENGQPAAHSEDHVGGGLLLSVAVSVVWRVVGCLC